MAHHWNQQSQRKGQGLFSSKTGFTADVRIVIKALDRGAGYGIEVFCAYRLTGQEKDSKHLKSMLVTGNYLSMRHTHQKNERLK